ncbi:uncharacterized protein LOC131858900 [Cryptomeria japonica]|uniref:uncharacterized protein LOC131858900 n=1 Tax=Cryptomeria japonica TaxID=3369 RepID=UPI0027DA9F16|nr:uncharacterized protein LOC131858900 [Cryptomeria japonica]
MVEALGRMIKSLHRDGRWLGVNVATGVEHSTHLQFSDDTILFGASSRREARIINACLNDYCKALGQKINWNKSEVFFINMMSNMQVVLSRILNLRVANFPGKFLGTPLFSGHNKTCYWTHLIEKCKARLENWKGEWLSSIGKLTMIKSVLSAILVFSMACMKLPVAMEDELITIMKIFLWNGSNDKGNFPLISWGKISQPKNARGASIRQISIMNLAMGAKLVWEICRGGNQK